MYDKKFIIAFEGIEGSGKTIQCEKLSAYLTRQGFRNRLEKYPESLLNKQMFEKEIKPHCTDKNQFYKFVSEARAYERSKYIFMNFLKNSDFEIIICDRYKYTDNVTLTYYKEDKHKIDCLSNWLPKPDLLFYLDIDVDIALQRIQLRGGPIRWHQNRKYLSFISIGFGKQFRNVNSNLYKLDSSNSTDSLHTEICNAFREQPVALTARCRL